MRRAGERATLPFVILASGFPPTRLWMTAPAYIPIPRHPEYAGASEDAEHLPNAPDVSEELTGQALLVAVRALVLLRGLPQSVHEAPGEVTVRSVRA
jgi:hypothetical protein